MKRYMMLSLLLALLLLVGCTDSAPETVPPTEATIPVATLAPTMPAQPETQPAEPDVPVTQIPMSAVFVPAMTETEYADDGTALFSYTHQSMSLVLQESEVAEKIILDFLNRVDGIASDRQTLIQSAKDAYSPSTEWVPYLRKVIYEPTRIDQSVLSLFGTNTSYAGGMHPDHLGVSVSYDLLTGDVLTLASIMHKDADSDTFCQLVLDSLSQMEKTHYLFEGYESAVEKRFMKDSSQDEAFFFTPTGLSFYFSPYEIAPYAAGFVVAEIPYEQLMGVLHDSYFPGETNRTASTITSSEFQDAQVENMSQICEAVLTPGAQMYMLTTDGAVENIRLELCNDPMRNDRYVLFAASSLSPGDGIMLQAEPEQLQSSIQVYYDNSDGAQIFAFDK